MDISPAHIWFTYFVPSLYGNGPEALAQTVVYGAIALAVYPPLRKWAKSEAEKVHKKLDHAERQAAHIIKHSTDIPPMP